MSEKSPGLKEKLATLEEEVNRVNWEGLSIHSLVDFKLDQTQAAPIARDPSVSQKTQETETTYRGPKGRDRMLDQMDRLVKRRARLQRKTGMKAAELTSENEEYVRVKTSIDEIRKRLKKLESDTVSPANANEIQTLRDQLAANLVAFKKFSKEPHAANIESSYEWHAQANQGYDKDTQSLLGAQTAGKAEAQFAEEIKVEPQGEIYDEETQKTLGVHTPSPETTPPSPEKKKWEERAELKRAWREKKDVYEKAYKQYLQDRARENENKTIVRKLQFWKKDAQPPELLSKEEEYLQASSAYAEQFQTALQQSRFVERKLQREQPEHGVNTWLAHLFVVQPGNEKLAIEKQFVPKGAATRNLHSLQEIFKKHGKKIQRGSLAATFGIAAVTGGFGAVVAALVGKTQAAAFVSGGSALGAGVLGGIGMYDIAQKGKALDLSLANAFTGYHANNIRALKRMYEDNARAYKKAIQNQKVLAASGAILGGIGGAALAGQLDAEALTQNMPDLELPMDPRLDIEVPDNTTHVPEGHKPDGGTDDFVYQDAPSEEGGPGRELEDSPKEGMGRTETSPHEYPTEADVSEEGMGRADTSPHEVYQTDDSQTEEEPSEEMEAPEILYTFERGGTVSDALFETWKESPELVDGGLTKHEFLADMYTAIAEIEKNPQLNEALMAQMGIASENIHEVQAGQTINLQPFFEYLNNKH